MLQCTIYSMQDFLVVTSRLYLWVECILTYQLKSYITEIVTGDKTLTVGTWIPNVLKFRYNSKTEPLEIWTKWPAIFLRFPMVLDKMGGHFVLHRMPLEYWICWVFQPALYLDRLEIFCRYLVLNTSFYHLGRCYGRKLVGGRRPSVKEGTSPNRHLRSLPEGGWKVCRNPDQNGCTRWSFRQRETSSGIFSFFTGVAWQRNR